MHKALLISLLVLTVGVAGCAQEAPEPEPEVQEAIQPVTSVAQVIEVPALTSMVFKEQVVTAAIGYTNDLYEPTMEVSDTGTIYVTGHTILVDTTGAPVFFSKDGGETWDQLPFLSNLKMPADMHGATPPPSDEIFLAAGDNGQLWGVDITLATFPINGWCGDAAEHCYHNPDGYDEVQGMATRVNAAVAMVPGLDVQSSCSIANLNDRPWVAYANNKLLLLNNPGGGPVQVGLMDVPAMPVGGPGIGAIEPVSADWNLCAGNGRGAIPGIPDMRDDHFFAVPQVQGGKLVIVKGHGNVDEVEQVTVFNNTNTGGGTSNYGQVVFDAEGSMFIGIRNNTQPDSAGNRTGQLHLAVSLDDGTTFVERTLKLTSPTTSVYMDGNMNGPGALLSWAQIGESGTDWYVAHMLVGPDGGPVIENPTKVVENGPSPSAHVQGAAAGPDGRAHIVTFHGGYGPTDGHNPLHVWVQQDGPMLPVTV